MSLNTSAVAALAAERGLTRLELDQGHLYLQQIQDGIVGAMKGLSEAQWRFKPAPDQWSIAQIMEHVIFVQERVLGMRREQLAHAPAVPTGYDYKRVDEIIITQFPNRLSKFPSPHQPAGDLARSEALDLVIKNQAGLAKYLDSTPDLRQHGIEAAPLKAVSNGAYEWMDGYQWILAAAAHTERHTKQILEVKANPDFPRTEDFLHAYSEWPRR